MTYLGRQLNAPASTVQLTAEGAITAGKPCIIEADGDVAQVAEGGSELGSAAVVDSNNVSQTLIAYDSSAGKVVIAYRDNTNANKGQARVGTVSGSSITFGTEVTFADASTTPLGISYDANAGKVVIIFYDDGNSNYGTAVVGTISGTDISFGTEVVYNSANSYGGGIAYDINAQKHLIAYRDSDNRGKARVGTVSGTSISFGTEAQFESSTFYYGDVTYDETAQKSIIFWNRGFGSGQAVVATISGTDVTYGSIAEFSSSALGSEGPEGAYDATSQKVVVAYSDGGNSNYGTAKVCTISGTSVSFGSAQVYNSTAEAMTGLGAGGGKLVVAYSINSTSKGKLNVGTVSGTSISWGSAVEFEDAQVENTAVAYDSTAGRFVIAYRDQGNSSAGTSIVFAAVTTNLTSENFIGFAENDCTDNGLATIQLGGSVNNKQTSLTAGQTYFVQTDGTIGTTADSPSVTAGTAVSSTEILVKG
jgi:hypothetical protein